MTAKRGVLMLCVAAAMVIAGCAQRSAPNPEFGMKNYYSPIHKRAGGFAKRGGR